MISSVCLIIANRTIHDTYTVYTYIYTVTINRYMHNMYIYIHMYNDTYMYSRLDTPEAGLSGAGHHQGVAEIRGALGVCHGQEQAPWTGKKWLLDAEELDFSADFRALVFFFLFFWGGWVLRALDRTKFEKSFHMYINIL